MRGPARVAPGACGGGGDREEGDVAFSAGDFFFVWWFGAGFVCIIVQPCFTLLTIVHLDKEIVRAGNKFYDIHSHVNNMGLSSLYDTCLRMNLKARGTHVIYFEIRACAVH
jgi:hypothetical protein